MSDIEIEFEEKVFTFSEFQIFWVFVSPKSKMISLFTLLLFSRRKSLILERTTVYLLLIAEKICLKRIVLVRCVLFFVFCFWVVDLSLNPSHYKVPVFSAIQALIHVLKDKIISSCDDSVGLVFYGSVRKSFNLSFSLK